MGNSIRARIHSGHNHYNLVTTSVTCWLPDSKCLLSSTLVSAGWCVVLPGIFISLLIRVSVGYLGLLVYDCWSWVCGNTMGVMYARDAHLYGPGPARELTAFVCARLGLGGNNLLLVFVSGLFLLSIWNNRDWFFSVSRLFLKDTVYCFFSKNSTSLCGCVRWYLSPFIELSEYKHRYISLREYDLVR